MAVIAYLNSFPAPNGVQILNDHGGHDLIRIDSADDEQHAFEQIATAHAWQCVGARDEVPPHFLVDARFLTRAPNLLAVSASGSGVDVFDRQACTDAGVLVVNQAGANAESVAEHAISMAISLLKHIGRADRALRAGWNGRRLEFTGRDLFGRTVGVIGLGNIGQRAAEIFRDGFRCEVLAYDPLLTEQQCAERGAQQVDLATLLGRSEVVTIHTPLTNQTRAMFGVDEFAQMQEGAVLVCTARGSIVDEEALADAIQRGHLAGAGLDVWEKEPPPSAHRLLNMENVIATPHVAGATTDSLQNMARFAATQLLDIVDGRGPSRVVNPEVIEQFDQRYKALLG